MYSIAEYCNNSILNIWRHYLDENSTELIPLLYNCIKSNCILFVGLNPSFNVKAIKNRLNKTDLEDDDIKNFFQWKNYNKNVYNKAIEDNKEAVKNYNYYRKLEIIAHEDLKEYWTHIDLFYNRETNQNNIKHKIYSNIKNDLLNQFANKQIELTWHIIKMIDPKLVVVQNVLASKIFKESFKQNINNYEKIVNSEEGYETIKINDAFIPIFFSGMLSGQRALDNFSYFRLRWHIKRSYNIHYR